jgi:excisionase family DNA binding protein
MSEENNSHLRVENAQATEPLWTVEDVADYLRLDPETVRSLARQKKLPGMKVGKVWRFRKAEILVFIARV